MRSSYFLLFGLLLLSSGCAEFLSKRDYLTEMDHDDSQFFNPHDDFPVVKGDTGRSWMSERERRERTPQSAEDVAQGQFKNSINRELKALENSLPEDALAEYEKYRPHLPTVSEKIYYLKLSRSERREYISARGVHIEESETVHDQMVSRSPAKSRSTELMGMSKEDVLFNYGKPLRVEVAGNPSYENERWLYNANGATKYIYFESGRVGGWE